MSSRWRVWGATAVLAIGLTGPALASCPGKPRSAADLAQCSAAATGGDGAAALLMGDALADPAGPAYDPAGARGWWERAAESGQTEALRRLFDARWYGRSGPRDPAQAHQTLERAAAQGAAWARLVRALLLESESPAAAVEGYLSLANDGHCLAQLRLAHAYDRGGLVEKSASQALFWAEIAARAHPSAGHADTHPLFESRFHYGECATEAFFFQKEVAQGLPEDQRDQIDGQAAAWRPGQPIVRAGGASAAAPHPAAAAGPPPAAEAMPAWRPLPGALRRPAGRRPMPAEDLFATVGRSVHVVVAAHSEEDLKAGRARFGSAVAMDERTLATNCHVVAGMTQIWLRQGGQTLRAMLAAADPDGDRCLLTVSPGRLSAVPGVRGWDDLKVGETVYSIGAPRGLESTLGQGLISGLRTIKGLHHVQTTAPISAGSSGGGLFDSSGNLVGITTFRLHDAEGLNFAIAVDGFFQ